MTIAFTAVEQWLEICLWDLIDPNRVGIGGAVTFRMSFRQMCELLSMLAERQMQDRELAAELLAVLPRLRAANERRNNLIHSVWVMEGDKDAEVQMRLYRRKKEHFFSSEDIESAEIDRFAAELDELHTELFELWQRMGSPSPSDPLRTET